MLPARPARRPPCSPCATCSIAAAEGDFRCVYVNIEAAQAVREDVQRAMQVILGELALRARSAGDEFLHGAWPNIVETFGEGALAEALTRWCENTAAPVVLLIDEIDSLIGDTLIAVLRQLRGRYDQRPESFPQSVVLCGVPRRARLSDSVARRERSGSRRQRVQRQGGVVASR